MEMSKSPNQCIRFHPLLPLMNTLFLQHFSLKTCNTCLTLSPEFPLHSRCLMHQVFPIWKEESPSMYREQFSGECIMAEDPHAPKRNRRTSPHRFPRCYRVCVLLVLTLFGLHLLGGWCRFWREPLRATDCIRPDGSCCRTRYASSGWPGSRSYLWWSDKRQYPSSSVSQPP